MKYQVDFSTTKPQNPDIAFVKLTPENEPEKKLLDENTDTEIIELYYHNAIEKKLPGYVLLEVITGGNLWPYAADVSVQKIIGLG
jgi:hypothetical protein